jgi:hypothetical protein
MWFYCDKIFSEADIADDVIGFVYIITRLSDGKRYIGKKLFRFARTKKVKGKKKRFKIASDWESYYGSNKDLVADVEKDGASAFKREIIHLCKSKGICSYLESKEIILRDALLRDDYYNGWLTMKVSRSHIKDLISKDS